RRPRYGTGSGKRSCSDSLVFDQAQVDFVFAVLALQDAHGRRNAVGDPQDGLIVAAIGAVHTQGVIAEIADLYGFGAVGGTVVVLAHAADVDIAVLHGFARAGIAHQRQVQQQRALVARLQLDRLPAFFFQITLPLCGAGLPVVRARNLFAQEMSFLDRVLAQRHTQ